MARFGLSFIILITLFGCSATNVLKPAASDVRIYTTIAKPDQCSYLGEVIGTEGKWYSFWFISNYDLTKGARDHLRNQAHELGGNVIQVETRSSNYTSSTVYVGNVYHCPLNSDRN